MRLVVWVLHWESAAAGLPNPKPIAALQSMLTVCPKPPIESPSAAAVKKE
jgi:hypothetical protein